MDNQNYYYRSDSPHHSYRDRDRDRDRYRREDDPPRGRVYDYMSTRDFSPVKPRNRSPLQERIDRYSPELQRRKLSQSTEAIPLQGRLHLADPATDPHHARVRPLMQRSAPASRISKAEMKEKLYQEELERFTSVVPFSNNFDVNDYEEFIRDVKNYEIAKKFFDDMKFNQLAPSAEIYQELVKKAVEEDKHEAAQELAKEASSNLNIDVYKNLIELLVATDKPNQALKMLKHAGGLKRLHTFLTAYELSRRQPPDFLLENLMQFCRHKGELPADLDAANQLYHYTQRNRIRASVHFYIKLADVYYERGELQKAKEVFNTYIGYEVRREDKLDKLDLHGLTPRVGMILIRNYLDAKNDYDPFYIVTGQGHNNKEGVQFTMRDFILANFSFITKNWHAEVISTNPGRLKVKYIQQ